MSDPTARDGQGLTKRLVSEALGLRAAELPHDVTRVARDCLVDWLGCGLAALDQPVGRIVSELAAEEGGHAQATQLGRATRGTLLQAALVNGTLSHALDYDDVNLSVPGHMSAAILPAVIALAEQRRASGAQWLEAFVAGYEFACRVGLLVEPAHYANGFHATATIGTLGAAVACARLLELPVDAACHAVGLAATQAAGLKAMFGSMAKPLHAGLAAQAGLRATLLASRGLSSRPDALECTQGFVQVHGGDLHLDRALGGPTGGRHLLNNLFKFHAACYSTHSTIEAVSWLRREHGLGPETVDRIEVVADDGCRICNIQSPVDALEAKFSLRACAAFALLGIDTAALDSWDAVTRPEVARLIERVSVRLVPGMTLGDSVVRIARFDGRTDERAHDSGVPLADKAEQSRLVAAKFRAIVGHALDASRIDAVLNLADRLGDGDREGDLATLMRHGGAA